MVLHVCVITTYISNLVHTTRRHYNLLQVHLISKNQNFIQLKKSNKICLPIFSHLGFLICKLYTGSCTQHFYNVVFATQMGSGERF